MMRFALLALDPGLVLLVVLASRRPGHAVIDFAARISRCSAAIVVDSE
jgi:hypothetical protein